MATCGECGKHEMQVVKLKNNRYMRQCAGGKANGGCGNGRIISKAEAERLLGTAKADGPTAAETTQQTTAADGGHNHEPGHDQEQPRNDAPGGFRIRDYIRRGLV